MSAPPIPSCPRHPTAKVISARSPAVGRVWCCIVCGSRLGPAPDAPEPDSVSGEILNTDDVDTVPD